MPNMGGKCVHCETPHAKVQYLAALLPADSRLLVFGGQTEHVCQLNDVWEFSFITGRWAELSPPHFCTKKCAKRYLAA